MRRIAGVLAAAMLSPTAASATQSDTQLWTTATLTVHVGAGFSAYGEATMRFTGNVDRHAQTVVRGGIGYRVSKRVSVMAGYTYQQSHPRRPADLEGLFQQVQWKPGTLAGFDVSSLTRLDEYWTDTGGGTSLRLRESLRFRRPLGGEKAPSLVLDASAYANLVETEWGVRDGFDQLRLSAALSFAVTRTLDVDVGYLSRYADRTPEDRFDHIGIVRAAAHF